MLAAYEVQLGYFVLASTALSVLLVTVTAFSLATKYAAQREVKGEPSTWRSAPSLRRRRDGLRALVIPAGVTYVSAAMGGAGVSLLLSDRPEWRELAGAPGYWLVVAGFFLVVGTLLALIAKTPSSEWELVRSFDDLLLATRQEVTEARGQHASLWTARLQELDGSARSGPGLSSRDLCRELLQRAGVPVQQIPRCFRWPRREMRDGEPAAAACWRWAGSQMRWVRVIGGLTVVLLALVILLMALEPALFGYLFPALAMLGISIAAFPVVVRLDLIYWSRRTEEEDIFRTEILHNIERRRREEQDRDADLRDSGELMRELSRLLVVLTEEPRSVPGAPPACDSITGPSERFRRWVGRLSS